MYHFHTSTGPRRRVAPLRLRASKFLTYLREIHDLMHPGNEPSSLITLYSATMSMFGHLL